MFPMASPTLGKGGSGSSATYVGSTVAANSGGQSSLSLPAGSLANDFAIIFADQDDISIANGTGWTKLSQTNTGTQCYMWTHVLTSADITAGSISFPSSAFQTVGLFVWRGCNAARVRGQTTAATRTGFDAPQQTTAETSASFLSFTPSPWQVGAIIKLQVGSGFTTLCSGVPSPGSWTKRADWHRGTTTSDFSAALADAASYDGSAASWSTSDPGATATKWPHGFIVELLNVPSGLLTFVAASSYTGGATTVPVPSGSLAGDILLVFVPVYNGSGTIGSVVDSITNSTSVVSKVFAYTLTSTDITNGTVSTGTSLSTTGASACSYRGATSVVAGTKIEGTTTLATTNVYSGTHGNQIGAVFFGCDKDTTAANPGAASGNAWAPASWTNRVNTHDTGSGWSINDTTMWWGDQVGGIGYTAGTNNAVAFIVEFLY